MASTAPHETTSTRWAVAMILAVLCTLPVAGMAMTQYIDGRGNAAYQCAMVAELPAGALEGEDSLQEASVTWMPAGRQCTYSAVEGGTVSAQTGWPSTVAGMAATVLAAGLTVVALRYRGRRGYVTTLMPGAVIVLIWTAVIASAHTVLA